MRDPHVDSLKYRLQPDETWNYSNAPRLEGETADFRYVLANGTLTLHMNTHYGTVEEAKSSANEFLFLWELNSSLRFGQGAVRFVYEDAQIIERNPPPPGNLEVHMEGKTSFVARGELSMAAYPEPPSNMKFSPDLETLWIRVSAGQE